MKKFWPIIINCSKCGNPPDLTEVWVNADGYLLVEGYCTNCPRDIVAEPVHIWALMESSERQDRKGIK